MVGASSDGRLLFVAGTRPEALKLAPVILEARAQGHRPLLVATGQHRELLDSALAAFGLVPDHDLDVMRPGQGPADVIGLLVPALARLFARAAPCVILVQGDTATAFAGAQAAAYARVPLAHIEAGLRSGGPEPFPEEMHRRAIAQLADLHFAPTPTARAALLAEGIAPAAIYITGNTGIDALHAMAARLRRDPGLAAAQSQRFAGIDRSRPMILATIHRRENHGARLAAVLAALAILAETAEIVILVHPHPAVAAPIHQALAGRAGVHLLPPLDYDAFVWLMGRATLALTDSRGVQEEAPALGLPVLVLRSVTERSEGLDSGNARLIGTETCEIVAAARALLADAVSLARMGEAALPYGTGIAARHIIDILSATFGNSERLAG